MHKVDIFRNYLILGRKFQWVEFNGTELVTTTKGRWYSYYIPVGKKSTLHTFSTVHTATEKAM